MKRFIKFHLFLFVLYVHETVSYHSHSHRKKLEEVFTWKQIGYNFDGTLYLNSTDVEQTVNGIHFHQELQDAEKFFVQYNNVPIGMERYQDRVFVTVPRRRHGIPSTLNYIELLHSYDSMSPLLKPYPDTVRTKQLVSVYRPRVDDCGRLWVVDTGLLEVPGDRRQVQPPSITVFDLENDKQILRYELKKTDLVNERTPGGLTSITVDVTPDSCDDAYAYINDLATEGLIVFSMRQKDSWRFDHDSFRHEENALNFSSAGYTINWEDGLFSIALSNTDKDGKRIAYYHALVSTQEFAIDTEVLKNRSSRIEGQNKLLGYRGAKTQSASHGYHSATRTLLFANVAQDAILCWNVDTELNPSNVAMVVQDHKKLVYISDLKVIGDEVWVLSNQIPRFVYSTLNPVEDNYFMLRGSVKDLIRGTVCDCFNK